MIYSNERPVEMLKTVSYVGYPGLMDKDFFIVGKKQFTKSDEGVMKAVNKILQFYGLGLAAVQRSSRKTLKVRAKYMSYYILFTYFKLQKVDIGEIFCVHHSTIIHGISLIKERLYKKHNLYETELRAIMKTLNR